mmetsp:Transcript_43524/g.112434  ORF Transcript_43524/g.112434 Transcript_43524/m.112434 type:complete len:353 (-) Transcript_43524:199-1257(-)|eukprot:CAMPEP_0195054862 /NCGR_PEP_ID=MMETSP0448-20130528/3650_1 /TAXON_ID=66468 /ORGANISM="Heterocapsa triquestra, Strain CCMP 448" /LENGTH=352 /DNA_ID=CAMNT_0040084423 /DNA_START=103 /DNA_END=1161 /DNA_ORIENTATION=+
MAVLDFSFLNFQEDESSDLRSSLLRQMSEPPILPGGYTSPVGLARSMSSSLDEPLKVTQRKRPAGKKTCFDLSDAHEEEDLALHRQMSEPVKVYMSCGVGKQGKQGKNKGSEDTASGSEAESQATTSTVSGSSSPGVTTSACMSSKDDAPGSQSPAGQLGHLVMPPGLALPPGLRAEATAKKDDSELPQKVPTPFCASSMSASAPEFTPGDQKANAEKLRVANTVTVSNLPEQYTRDSLVGELQDSGFVEGRDFDYLSVPLAARGSGSTCGHVFINFVNPGLRHAFVAAFQGRELRYGAGRPLQVKSCVPSDLAASATSEPRRAKFCPQCGTSIQGSFNFCTQCGSSLKSLT